ncbi:MAG: hypothetical protein WA783_18485 [Phormidesmis sp.]
MSPVVAAKATAVKGARSAGARSVGATTRVAVLLRDRFQGALLGLMLVPTAVSLHRSHRVRRYAAQMTDEVAQYFQQWASLHTFLQQSAFYCSNAGSDSSANSDSVWLASTPLLLRFHNQPPQTRHQYIQNWHIQNWLTADAAATAQQWVLSDVLTRALEGNLARQGWDRWVSTERSSVEPSTEPSAESSAARDFMKPRQETYRKDQPLALYDYHYQGVWNAILEDAPIFQATLTAAERLYHRETIIGVSKAIEYGSQMRFLTGGSLTDGFLANDSLADGSLAGSSSSDTFLTYALGLSQALQSTITPEGLADWRVLLIVGLVLGAAQGRSGLPVLWQRSSSLSSSSLSRCSSPQTSRGQADNCLESHPSSPAEALALANELFSQWSGCIA